MKGIGIISDSLLVLNKECNMIYYTIKAILMIDMTIKFGEKMKIILEKTPVEQRDN